MVIRCRNCGNEFPPYAHGNCYVCGRNERDERRDSDVGLRRRHRPLRRAPLSEVGRSESAGNEAPLLGKSHGLSTPPDGTWQLRTGIWRNKDRSITLDFRDGKFRQRHSGNSKVLPLAIVAERGPDVRLKIGRHQVRAWVAANGDLTLHRRTTMGFLCWVDAKLHKLCRKCRRLSPVRRRSCPNCGRGWPR